MLLKNWLTSTNTTPTEFAIRVSAKKRNVFDWQLPLTHPRRRIPRHDQMIRIYIETGGEVTPNDFYDLPDLAATGADDDAAAQVEEAA